ncbi:hypothetical protein BDW02DRAFT_585960 [Decorospora gaudefroyi]|uniref:BZIP domain-containing protein n=1 Tax=Decorospora gaudefroyi TaxID=184978 RepID=A0A6A5KQI7_9PLEO|nr:hypothetical protein BDW02DRAFT_585960 [Decorospora gaudefroyi]
MEYTTANQSFHNPSDWTAFPISDSPYLGHGTSFLSGGPMSFITAEANMNNLAMPSGMGTMHNTNRSTPMRKDHSQSGSSSSSHKDCISSSPDQSSSSRLPTTKNSPLGPDTSSKVEKRKANTLAARRYRQKRVDQMSGLEAELKEVKAERDDLKVRHARLEGEVETLRALLRSQK